MRAISSSVAPRAIGGADQARRRWCRRRNEWEMRASRNTRNTPIWAMPRAKTSGERKSRCAVDAALRLARRRRIREACLLRWRSQPMGPDKLTGRLSHRYFYPETGKSNARLTEACWFL